MEAPKILWVIHPNHNQRYEGLVTVLVIHFQDGHHSSLPLSKLLAFLGHSSS